MAAGVAIGTVAVGFGVGEWMARRQGHRPFGLAQLDIRVEPGGKLYQPHPDRGYHQVPGQFLITLPDGYQFQATHGSNGLRITHPLDSVQPRPRGELWIMGCSLTHGWGVNDADTYAWQVQAALPDYEVLNCGVGGYGTLQSRLLFQELETQRPQPAAVVVAYGTFHDLRNTFVRTWRKNFAPLNRLGDVVIPYARLVGPSEVDYYLAPLAYREWPFMRQSALVHAMEEQYNAWELGRVHSDQVSARLLVNWAAYCAERGLRFIVAGISSDAQPMLDYCRRCNIETVDLAVRLADPGMSNLPHDNHPSAAAHRIYATRLSAFLRHHLPVTAAQRRPAL